MKRTTAIAQCLALILALASYGCNDAIEVQRKYDFTLSTWQLPRKAKPGNEVEIRFTIERGGYWLGARYDFCWVRQDGVGELCDASGMTYADRENYELRLVYGLTADEEGALHFTLYYRMPADGNGSFAFIVTDNFGTQRQLSVSFAPQTQYGAM